MNIYYLFLTKIGKHINGLSYSGSANPLKAKNNIKVGKSPYEGLPKELDIPINEHKYAKVI